MSSEQELIQWLKQFKNRKELMNKYERVYHGLYLKYPYILDCALPLKAASFFKKEQLLEIAINNEDRPHKNKHLLGKYFHQYINKANSSYDKDFTDKIKEIRPDWFENRTEKVKRLSFEKMMKSMPSFVKFKEGQEWKGTNAKHIFICEKYGEFESNFDRLSRQSWLRNLSGHPKMGQDMVKAMKRDGKGRILSKTTKQKLKSKQS